MDLDGDGHLDILSGSYSRMDTDMAGLFQVLYGNPDGTNIDYIIGQHEGLLGPYVKTEKIFKCPTDHSVTKLADGKSYPRVRSYSMNGWVGDGTSEWTSGFQIMTNRSRIRQPDRTFVFIEEHPASINDGLFVVDMSASGPLVDYPVSYHYSGANLGFADGSVVYHQWLNIPATIGPILPPIRGPDVTWLQSVTTYRK